MTDEYRDNKSSADTANEGLISDYKADRRNLLKTTGRGFLGLTSLRHATSRVAAEHQLIENWNNLYDIRGRLEGDGEDYVLVADLDADTPGYDDHIRRPAGGWEPIDDAGSDNSWSLYGDGYSISDLVIDRPDESAVGLFGEVANGQIEDLSVQDADITGGDNVGTLIGSGEDCAVVNSDATGSINGESAVGGLIGRMLIGEITDSYSEQSVTGSTSVGGLVGSSDNLDVSDSYSTGSVSSDGGAGGLIGADEGSTITESHAKGSVDGNASTGGLLGSVIETEIKQCFATGTVSGDRYAGGLVGLAMILSVNRSYATGEVSGTSEAGGLVGQLSDGGSISESYATGSIDAEENAGGLVGYWSGGGSVTTSYAIGSVNGEENVGGLVGYIYGPSNVNESYAAGSVSGNDSVGGLVGWFDQDRVTDSYWDVPATGQDQSAGGGTGLGTLDDEPPADALTGTDAEKNIEGFDFEQTWNAVKNPPDYPVLQWQDVGSRKKTDGRSGGTSNSTAGAGALSEATIEATVTIDGREYHVLRDLPDESTGKYAYTTTEFELLEPNRAADVAVSHEFCDAYLFDSEERLEYTNEQHATFDNIEELARTATLLTQLSGALALYTISPSSAAIQVAESLGTVIDWASHELTDPYEQQYTKMAATGSTIDWANEEVPDPGGSLLDLSGDAVEIFKLTLQAAEAAQGIKDIAKAVPTVIDVLRQSDSVVTNVDPSTVSGVGDLRSTGYTVLAGLAVSAVVDTVGNIAEVQAKSAALGGGSAGARRPILNEIISLENRIQEYRIGTAGILRMQALRQVDYQLEAAAWEGINTLYQNLSDGLLGPGYDAVFGTADFAKTAAQNAASWRNLSHYTMTGTGEHLRRGLNHYERSLNRAEFGEQTAIRDP